MVEHYSLKEDELRYHHKGIHFDALVEIESHVSDADRAAIVKHLKGIKDIVLKYEVKEKEEEGEENA